MKTFEMKTVIHFGDNSLERLKVIPYKRVLIITDPFIANGDMIDLITAPLKSGGIQYDLFTDVVPDAPIGKVAEAISTPPVFRTISVPFYYIYFFLL